MLSLYISRYGMPDTQENYVSNPDAWFDHQGNNEWILGNMERQIIQDIDGSNVITSSIIENPIFGAIPPSRLSGTVKTLILIKNDSNRIFDGSWLGEDAAPWLLRIGNMCDRVVRLGYLMPFEEPFLIRIANDGSMVSNVREYYDAFFSWSLKEDGI